MSTPRLLRNLLVSLSLVAICLIFVSFVAPYTTKTLVIGQLVPEKGIARVLAPDFGIVTDVWVQEGDYIARGDRLASIRNDSRILSTRNQSGRLSKLSNLAIDKIDKLTELSESELKPAERRLVSEMEALQRSLAIAKKRQEMQDQRVAVEQKRLLYLASIRKTDVVSGDEVRSQEATVLEQRQRQERIISEVVELRSQIDEIAIRLDMERASASAEYSARKQAFQQVQMSTDAGLEYVIESPVDATVASIVVKPGQSVSSFQSLAVLIPDGSTLIAELYAPSHTVGIIEIGQSVVLNFGESPSTSYGSISGTVQTVSSVLLTDRDIGVDLSGQGHTFIVRVALSSQTVRRNGVEVKLQPGMEVTAQIFLNEQPVAEWLFSRITRNI